MENFIVLFLSLAFWRRQPSQIAGMLFIHNESRCFLPKLGQALALFLFDDGLYAIFLSISIITVVLPHYQIFDCLGPWKKSKEQLNNMCSALRINWEPLSFTNLAMLGVCAMEGSRLKLWSSASLVMLRADTNEAFMMIQTSPNWQTLPSATAPWNKIRFKHHYETRRRFNGNG